ncbi:MAG: LacI family DNA-binding transcriptional regulator [Solirubrobacteraceae bacterium]
MTPRIRKPPTIFEVAALAGVSKSTVSNVIRDVDGVAPSTRERVLVAIERLGYRPNALARQFVAQRTTTFGVLVGDLDNPFCAEMAKLIERWAFHHGYTAMFCNIEGDDDLAVSGVEALLEQHVAGVVFLAFFGRSPAMEELLRQRAPIVFVGLREDWGDSVAVGDADGGRLATGHLIELGHREIAYLTTPAVEPRADRACHAGYRAAMRRAGLAARPAIRWVPGTEEVRIGGQRAALTDVLVDRDRPTAVFVSNDLGAIALQEFIDLHGLRVPEDVSLIGFDNVSLAGLARISLTTVAQPLDELARLGVERLVERIERWKLSGRQDPPRAITVPVELVVRGSTGPPPHSSAKTNPRVKRDL